MYVFANNEDNNVLAYASACGYLGPNKRPISGSFTINMHHLTGDIECKLLNLNLNFKKNSIKMVRMD